MPDRLAIMADMMFPLIALTILTMPFFGKPQMKSRGPAERSPESVTIAIPSARDLKAGVTLHIEMKDGELFYSLDGVVLKDIPSLSAALKKLGAEQPGKVVRMKMSATASGKFDAMAIFRLCQKMGLRPFSSGGEGQ